MGAKGAVDRSSATEREPGDESCRENSNAFESTLVIAVLDIPTQYLGIVRRRARISDQKSSWYAYSHTSDK
jgi:hypothetical protein